MPDPALKRSVSSLALGLGAGLLSGLFGIGGGTVLVPGLILLLGLSQHHAHATSLAAIILTATAALVPFARGGSVAFAAGGVIAAGALLGAYLGAGLMRRVSARRLRQAFAVVALAVAVQLIAGGDSESGGVAAPLDLLRLTGLAGLGLATGVLSALMGVGGGLIMVPGMVLLLGFSQHTAEGTSLLVIVPTALTGALRHSRSGFTHWRLSALIGVGGMVGGVVGGRLALALAGAALQRLFGVFLVAVAVRLLVSSRAREPFGAT